MSTTSEQINSAAKMLIADMWHDLPECETTDQWERYFRTELCQLIQDQSHYQYSGYYLLRWIRKRASDIYEANIKQPHHIGSHKLGYVSRLSTCLISVLNPNEDDYYYLFRYQGFLMSSYVDTVMRQDLQSLCETGQVSQNPMFYDISFN